MCIIEKMPVGHRSRLTSDNHLVRNRSVDVHTVDGLSCPQCIGLHSFDFCNNQRVLVSTSAWRETLPFCLDLPLGQRRDPKCVEYLLLNKALSIIGEGLRLHPSPLDTHVVFGVYSIQIERFFQRDRRIRYEPRDP